MNLENTVINNRSQSLKSVYCLTPLLQNVQKKQIYRDGKQMSGFPGLGGNS